MTVRELLHELRDLARTVEAPQTVLSRVLDELELGDRYTRLETVLGAVFVAWNRVGVSAVMKTPTSEEFEQRFQERFGRKPRYAEALPEGIRDRFDLRSVTEFERAVLLKAREIPNGEVRTYGWIAAQIGHPRAVRAVGTALRKNPIPILIPCHRVVRSDGHIGQYALGGSMNKRAILAAEGLKEEDIEQLARRWRASANAKVTAYG